jgi:hypothetical protein
MSEFTTPQDLGRERIARAFGWDAGNPDPWALPMEFARQALTYAPMAMRAGMGGVRLAPVPEHVPAPVPEGPWSSPAYMRNWLSNRYQPEARPQAWQPERRWGSAGNDDTLRWGDVVAGRIRPPRNRSEMIEAAKGIGALAGATGGAYGAGQFGFDTLYNGEPWQTASWRALMTPQAGQPPDWWPQPPLPSGPQPPSRLR